jgi:Ca2+-binding EF-hand superfamily protein
MARIPKGNWSKVSIEAMRKAEEMQGMAVAYINDSFSVETDELDINQMTFGEFVRALEQAEKNGTREELERRLAEQLMPMIETVMAQPQQPPEGGATQ